jgi:hypothetical protein
MSKQVNKIETKQAPEHEKRLDLDFPLKEAWTNVQRDRQTHSFMGDDQLFSHEWAVHVSTAPHVLPTFFISFFFHFKGWLNLKQLDFFLPLPFSFFGVKH